jgi:hypothetical protein
MQLSTYINNLLYTPKVETTPLYCRMIGTNDMGHLMPRIQMAPQLVQLLASSGQTKSFTTNLYKLWATDCQTLIQTKTTSDGYRFYYLRDPRIPEYTKDVQLMVNNQKIMVRIVISLEK